jgi:hypothetical protein
MKTPTSTQSVLDELVAKLHIAAAQNLEAIVLYGSAAGDEFDPDFSDLNVLCLMKTLGAAELRSLGTSLRWWRDQGQPSVMLFSTEELQAAADVFAIELFDIKARHRVLFGPDVFQSFHVPMSLHRTQVERELRQNTIKLRQGYVPASGDAKAVTRLMAGSVSTFVTLFRHALIAFGEDPPLQRTDTVKRAATVFGFDPSPMNDVLRLREDKTAPSDADSLFGRYLAIIEQVTSEVDRRLS